MSKLTKIEIEKREKEKRNKAILKDLKPIIKKWGEKEVRGAIFTWARRVGERNMWLEQKKEADKKLKEAEKQLKF